MSIPATTIPAPSAEHIVSLFESIDPADVSAGLDWYAEAYGIAETLGVRFGVSTEQAAGVIAALSPMQKWARNIVMAERILSGDYSGYMQAGLDKCRRIVAGEDVVTVLNGQKITNFYLSIVSQGTAGMTIDRHAWDIAVGIRHTDATRPTINPSRYAAASDAYAEAARILESQGAVLHPAQVQSITWAEQVRRFGGSRG